MIARILHLESKGLFSWKVSKKRVEEGCLANWELDH